MRMWCIMHRRQNEKEGIDRILEYFDCEFREG